MAYERPKNDLISIQGGEITLAFLQIVDQMLWALTFNLECFLQTIPSPSLILLTLLRDWLFKVYLMHPFHYFLLLKFNLLLVTLTLIKFTRDVRVT